MVSPMLREPYGTAVDAPGAIFKGMKAADWLPQLLALPVEERAMLAHELLKSLSGAPKEGSDDSQGTPEEIEAAWNEEILRRSSELDQGTVKAIPWSEHESFMDQKKAAARAKRNR